MKAEINEGGELAIHAEEDREVGKLRQFFNNEIVRMGGLSNRIGFRVDPPIQDILRPHYSATLYIQPDKVSPGNARDRRFVLVTERDNFDAFTNGGAICFEQYMANASLHKVTEQAKNIGNRYGKIGIFALTELGSPEECEKILGSE